MRATIADHCLDIDPLQAVDPSLQQLASLSGDDPDRERLREEIICHCAPAARREAARYRNTGEPLEDLVQVATVGLILAVDRFDPGRRIPFRHYALPTISGELKRYFRDKGWSVRVNRRLQELSLQVRRTEPALAQQLGRTPNRRDLAHALGRTEEEIAAAQESESAHFARSLSRPVYDDDESADLAETLGSDDQAIAALPDHDALRRALRSLSPRLAMVVSLRFLDELTQTEIGDKIGVSQMHVSRLLDRAMTILRGHMTADSGADHWLGAGTNTS